MSPATTSTITSTAASFEEIHKDLQKLCAKHGIFIQVKGSNGSTAYFTFHFLDESKIDGETLCKSYSNEIKEIYPDRVVRHAYSVYSLESSGGILKPIPKRTLKEQK